MVRHLSAALAALRGDLPASLSAEAIEDAFIEAGQGWRNRLLGPAQTVHLFLLQILNGNAPIGHLLHLAGKAFSKSAFVQARMRLPLAALRLLAERVARSAGLPGDDCLWRGHRTWALDGTGVSMPDEEALRAEFGQPAGQASGCGFPAAHLLCLFEHRTGLLREVSAGPLATHDLARAHALHRNLRRGDVLLGDRAFGSFAHLALLQAIGCFGVFRMHQRMRADFRPRRPHGGKGQPSSAWLRALGEEDQLTRWPKPRSGPGWLAPEQYAALPESIVVRELRYRVARPGFRTRVVTLATTLADADKYPAGELAQLYRERWDVEVNLRHLKATMGMDALRCKTVDGVLKEMAAFALVYNLVRAAMLESARRRGLSDPRDVSFIDAWRWLRQGGDPETLARLGLVDDRPDRVEPRVRKRRPKQFPLMTQPRQVLKDKLLAI